MTRSHPRAVRALALLSMLVFVKLAAAAEPKTFVWLEGESPTEANYKPTVEANAQPGLLSGGKWLHESIQKDQLNKIPADGLLLRWDVQAPADGTYEIWARVGFEWIRSPMEWRIANGPWSKVTSERRTTNLMRLATWTEVAWQFLGTADLKSGRTSLQIRYKEPNKDGSLVAALDCVALTLGHFVPEGKLKPGETYDSADDQAAAAHVFPVEPAKAPGARSEISLDGAWQVARYDDPDMDKDPYAAVQSLPGNDEYPLRWMGVSVPQSAWAKPELAFGHRMIYRTKLAVPADLRGRSFSLHFSGTNWIVSVFVNGQLAGTHKGVLVPWDIDVTRGMKAGQTNEIAVAVKGSYYAFDTRGGEAPLEKSRNLPPEMPFLQWTRWIAPIWPSTKGERDGIDYGIINPVRLTVAGDAYASDVFVKPSVSRKRLDCDLTISNTTGQARQIEIRTEAVNEKTGQVEHQFPAARATVDPNAEKTIPTGGEWENPKLWWPVDNPDLYRLRTTLLENGTPIDVHEQLFGFRELSFKDMHLRINGVIRNFWNWVGVSGDFATPQDWLKAYRAEDNRFYRFSHDAETRKWFPTREGRLDFYDRNGVPGRLSTCVDGMSINYDLGNDKTDAVLWPNFEEHILQVVKAYRNHPSIMMYSVENELMFISAQNTGTLDRAEPQLWKIVQHAQQIDPTRPYMGDGAGALKGDLLDINCMHYPEPAIDEYPGNAFTFAKISEHSARWPWDRKRPLVLGEDFFYAGKLEDQAWIGGDDVFRGRDFANLGASKWTQLLVEGYRWQGATGICPWVALSQLPGAQVCFKELAAFPRKQSHRFYSGRPNSALVKVFNDTLSADPVTFEWEIDLAGKRVAGEKHEFSLEPGTGAEQTLRFDLPPAPAREDGELILRVSQNGKLGFEDRRPVAALPPVDAVKIAGPLLLLDRSNLLEPWLNAAHVPFQRIDSLAALKDKKGLALIGPDTLTPDEAFGSDALAFAIRGGRVIALEQDMPFAGAALPVQVRSTDTHGGYAFGKAFGTPLFANLKQGDFIDWTVVGPTFKKAYEKAGSARTLIECGDGLNFSAMLEMPAGDGVVSAIQMRVGANLGHDPAADHLLKNALEYYGSAFNSSHGVAAVVGSDAALDPAVAETGVATQSSDLAQALDPAKFRAVVLRATPANLQDLTAAGDKLKAFTDAGGWVMLFGLQPDGADAFNKLTGGDQMIRPFRLERVTLERPDSPLAATLGNRDVAMFSTDEIMFGNFWLSEHVYTHVLEADDAAPFTQVPGGPADLLAPYKPSKSDNDPFNLVNGMFNSDTWRAIRQFGVPTPPLTFNFHRPETIRQVNVWNNTNYWTIKDLDVIIDGDEASAVHAVLPANSNVTPIVLNPPRKVTKSITLQVRSWRETEHKEPKLVGIDNVQFLRDVPAAERDRVQPLDNVGGLTAYPRGKGGLFLNQLDLSGDDPNPINRSKKIRLIATLLQNMGVSSRGTAVAVAGVNVNFTPIDINQFTNRHIKEHDGQPGWFGDKNQDLRQLPVGNQFLADVQYHVTDFNTSPVPQSIVLGGPTQTKEVKGIPLHQKADVLYFLHSANVTNPVNEGERARTDFKPPEVLRYVVHYADGSTENVPVYLGENIDHWLQTRPQSLPGGRVAWTAKFPDLKEGPQPVVYSMSWTNPKPGVEISTIDVVEGKDSNRATPAVIAVTAGRQAGATGAK